MCNVHFRFPAPNVIADFGAVKSNDWRVHKRKLLLGVANVRSWGNLRTKHIIFSTQTIQSHIKKKDNYNKNIKYI